MIGRTTLDVGKLDDMAAGVLAGCGLTMMWAGWNYGTGPKPPEAIAAATHVTAAYEYCAPARAALLSAVKAGYNAGVAREAGIPRITPRAPRCARNSCPFTSSHGVYMSDAA